MYLCALPPASRCLISPSLSLPGINCCLDVVFPVVVVVLRRGCPSKHKMSWHSGLGSWDVDQICVGIWVQVKRESKWRSNISTFLQNLFDKSHTSLYLYFSTQRWAVLHECDSETKGSNLPPPPDPQPDRPTVACLPPSIHSPPLLHSPA